MFPSSIDDIRFTIQRGYLSENFKNNLPSNITNNVIVIPGDALLAANNTDVELFINTDERKITEALDCYLFKNNISPETSDLAVINIEAKDRLSYAPNDLYKWKGSKYWNDIIKGYKKRIAATRAFMPNAHLSFFQVVRPLNRGTCDTRGNLCIFELRVSALKEAGKKGMFDNLDYLSPPFYLRLDSSEDDVNDLSLTQGIQSSLEIEKSSGRQLPLAPFISFWVFSDRPYPVANSESVKRQLEIMQGYSEIEIVVFWSGREKIQKAIYKDVDFIAFFEDLF